MQERATGPTVTWHCSLETIAGESKGADCYLALFAYRRFRYMMAVMVLWPMVEKLVVAGDLNMDLLRTGKVAVEMLVFRTFPHTFSRDGVVI